MKSNTIHKKNNSNNTVITNVNYISQPEINIKNTPN